MRPAPGLALGIRHDGVAVRRLEPATQPVRHVQAATRPAISGTTPVQTMLSALQAEADAQRDFTQPSGRAPGLQKPIPGALA